MYKYIQYMCAYSPTQRSISITVSKKKGLESEYTGRTKYKNEIFVPSFGPNESTSTLERPQKEPHDSRFKRLLSDSHSQGFSDIVLIL
jgi:hypothetical protein